MNECCQDDARQEGLHSKCLSALPGLNLNRSGGKPEWSLQQTLLSQNKQREVAGRLHRQKRKPHCQKIQGGGFPCTSHHP